MFKYMSEIKQYTSFSFSGSPEYVDVFNDESTSLVSDNENILGALCASQNTCLLETCSPQVITTGVTGTGYSIALGLGISVYTNYIDGTNVQCTSASTSNSWGRKIYAQYLGPDMYDTLFSGDTCVFQQVTDATNKNYYYFIATTSCGNSSCATTIQRGYQTSRYDFKITYFPGHNVPCNFYLSGTGVGVKLTSGQSLSIVTYPSIPKSIYVSALTYNTVYSSGTSSTAATEALRNSKIGTKYTVTTVAANKTAKTVSGGSYVYSTSCVSDTNTRMLRPHNPFFIQTSAQSLTINYERIGSVSSGKTYDLSSYSNLELPIQGSNYRLATINDISNTNGLGITIFNSIFNSSNVNFKNMVITPNQYDLLVPSNLPNNVVYTYKKPALFFKAATTNNDYCLRMNDISTFDKWMYLLGGITSSTITSTSDNFDYKNYDSTNVYNNRDWASNLSDKNAYFTLILK